ncbi:unnamed protein product [Taenia asiatica]|uniref:Zinc finger CCHC domain-containing protein 7 n=1 Tax=Taenia asiatica TaxID=60517 RepID=A0A0R3VVP3_TAEAS|nr:unnamed protein product [Taenia asiatica]
MEEEEVDYDSDHIDEETEARLYASVFYDDDADEVKRCQAVTSPTKSDRSFDVTSSSLYCTPEVLPPFPMNKSRQDSFIPMSQEFAYKNTAIDSTLLEALYLTITGNTPHSVIQKADERMGRYMEQNDADEHSVCTYDADPSSDSSFSNDLPPKRPKLDLLLGISKRSIEDLKKTKELLLEHLEDLPSDGKYWSLDSSDMSSLSCGKRRYREPDGTCERCFKKGHTWLECTRICPDIWRQYKYTTQPGKPVVVTPSNIRRAKSCFNCGGRGHTGEHCRKPTVDGRSAIQTSIFKFDDCDVYAEASKNIQRPPICPPCARQSRTYVSMLHRSCRSRRQQSTVRLRPEKADKRRQKTGLWRVEDLPNVATSPYLKLMRTFHIDA